MTLEAGGVIDRRKIRRRSYLSQATKNKVCGRQMQADQPREIEL
jgi:hypothetical protein